VGINKKLILGIDPGLSGALALYNPLIDEMVMVWDMPTFDIKGKKQIDAVTLAMQIEMHVHDIQMAMVEKVGAMPGQGVTSMFSFGKACGIVQGILAAYMIPVNFISPAVWKSSLGLSQDKDESRQRVINKFPSHANFFSRKKDDGRAEALLIAMFGCMKR
jgi:crossover junction endodeoxyribonuclease RuvC